MNNLPNAQTYYVGWMTLFSSTAGKPQWWTGETSSTLRKTPAQAPRPKTEAAR